MSRTLHLGASSLGKRKSQPVDHPSIEALRLRHERSGERDRLQSTLEAERVRFSAVLRTEREARQNAEQRLAEAEGVIRDIETRLAHAVLAREEATLAVSEAVRSRLVAEANLAAERILREKVEERLSTLSLPLAVAVTVKSKVGRRSAGAATEMAPHQRCSPAKPVGKLVVMKGSGKDQEIEPQPVKWWLKKKN
jgi:hypothetical protein